MNPFKQAIVIFSALVGLILTANTGGADEPAVEKYLVTGKFSDGITDLEQHLKQNADDQQARFGVGVLQFLKAVEGLSQDQYRYGLLYHHMRAVPVLGLSFPLNENPEQISYQQARAVLQKFVDRLETAEKTLAEVDTRDVKLPIHFGQIRLDQNGDGIADEGEMFWRIYSNFNRNVNAEIGAAFIITFDGGDVHWLRGYCHLLMGMGEFVLAHDWEDQFERTAHLFYPKVKSEYPLIEAEETGDFKTFRFQNALDLIAFIHLINYEVVAPEKMKACLEHLEAMTVQSQLSWKLIRAEQDDDREWLPNPEQTGVIPGVQITAEMIDSWEETMSEMQAIFKGEKLLPYWRGKGTVGGFGQVTYNRKVGINLRKVFTEPTRFDLLLWVQGTAATPYLESFEQTQKSPVDSEIFDRMFRVFGGEFLGFAIWFN